MKRIKLLPLLLALLLLFSLLSGCASDSTPSGSAADQSPASTAAPAPTTTAAPETTAFPTTAAPTEPAHTNERGPFDEEHYQIGLRSLQAVDGFLDGTLTISEVNRVLSSCYEEISALPELPESDPLYAGNDFVKSYVFLAQIDFEMQMPDFSTKKYEDRNYLAAAIGEPEKEFSAFDDEAQLKAYLDGLVAALNDADGDTLHYYSLSEDGVFFTISMPAFDAIYDNLDSLPASDLSAARNIALELVSGEFAEDLIAHIRANGGASKAVYITFGCSRGICMASRDLSVFMDELKR